MLPLNGKHACVNSFPNRDACLEGQVCHPVAYRGENARAAPCHLSEMVTRTFLNRVGFVNGIWPG